MTAKYPLKSVNLGDVSALPYLYIPTNDKHRNYLLQQRFLMVEENRDFSL